MNLLYSLNINLNFKTLLLRIVNNLISIFNLIVKRYLRKVFTTFARFFNNII